MIKSCDTCVYWSSQEMPHGRWCGWGPAQGIPFWASLHPTQDGGQLTRATDGARCPAWVLSTRLARG